MRDHLVAYFEAHHKLIEAGALQLLLTARQPLVVSRELVEVAGRDSPFVTREMVENVLVGRGLNLSGAARLPSSVPAAPHPSDGAGMIAPFSLLAEGYVAATVSRPPLEAYSALFASRYRSLSRLLKGRPDLQNVRPMAELKNQHAPASAIGMIRQVRETPEKHHIILTVEDETGSLDVLIPKDSAPARGAYLNDEVVGLSLTFSRERGRLPRVLAVLRPEVASARAFHRSTGPTRVVFLSDLHIGSRSFLSDAWGGLVDFLSGRGPRPELAHQVAHVVIAGDLVDGIGIYPNQERDLAIGDIVEQYAELGRRLRELPERLNVIVVPGNHDAVCPAEPQPGLPKELVRLLPPNVRALGNPSTFALEGVVIEAYHGRSFDDLIPAIPGASYGRPTEVMKRMLSMRHLGPMYGGRTPLAPQSTDGLVIETAPDIFVTGHAHTFGVDQYRGVLLLNASTWQAETEYQRMRNIVPVPARAAVVNLADLTLDALDFSRAAPLVGSLAA